MYSIMYSLMQLTNVLRTSLLHKLQAQTLPDATLLMGNIHPFSKIAVTFETMLGF